MHPEIFRVGKVVVHSYGTMLALAFLTGMFLLHRHANRVPGLKRDRVVDCVLFILVPSLAGARLLYVLLNLDQFASFSDALAVQKGGLSFHGGLLGGMAGLALFCRFYRISFLPLVDAVAPSAAIGYAITKIGCFLNGCCIGRPTDLPWGVCFPDPEAGSRSVLTPPSHPAQIYDAILNVLLGLALLRALRRKRFHGQTFFLYLVLYSAIRFAVECFRKGVSGQIMFTGEALGREAEQTPMLGWPPTQAQLASILVIVVFGLMYLILLARAPKEPLPLPEPPDSNKEEPTRKANPDRKTRRRKDRRARRRRDAKSREP